MDTSNKLNTYRPFKRCPGRLLSVLLMSCVQGGYYLLPYPRVSRVEIILLEVSDKMFDSVTSLYSILFLYRTFCIWPDLNQHLCTLILFNFKLEKSSCLFIRKINCIFYESVSIYLVHFTFHSSLGIFFER